MTGREPDSFIPRVLSIAGSDPSGGAGIQADLKTFSALGAYGMAALTALTAQNTRGVTGVSSVDPGFLVEQIDAVFADIRVDAVKIGMAGNADSVRRIAECLERQRPPMVVLDPVMVAKSGHRLLADQAVDALRDRLLPLASIVTPNLPEAAVLLDEGVATSDSAMEDVAERLARMGPGHILLKGGHLTGSESVDILHVAGKTVRLVAERIDTGNSHGTGCTLSSAIAALAPVASSMVPAARAAKLFVSRALAGADALGVGHGHGPVHHFHAQWASAPAAQLLAEVSRDSS